MLITFIALALFIAFIALALLFAFIALAGPILFGNFLLRVLIFARILPYRLKGNLKGGNRFKNGLKNRPDNNSLKGVNRLKNGLRKKPEGNYLKGINRFKNKLTEKRAKNRAVLIRISAYIKAVFNILQIEKYSKLKSEIIPNLLFKIIITL